jgi:hypothetical protein
VGRTLTWSFQLGGSALRGGVVGSGTDWGTSSVATPEGGIVLAGFTTCTDFPTLGGVQPAYEPPDQFDQSEGFVIRASPGAVPQLYEPSARDARTWVDPMTITKNGGVFGFDLGWEESMEDPDYGIYVGNLQVLHGTGTYDHGLLRCGLTAPAVSLEDVEGDAYFLIVAVDKHDPAGPRESSYGRDSFGVERPSGTPNCMD